VIRVRFLACGNKTAEAERTAAQGCPIYDYIQQSIFLHARFFGDVRF